MRGKIELLNVSLSSHIRPLFQETFYSTKGGAWDLWIEDGFVHIVDKTSKCRGHGIIHCSNCTMELANGAEIPKKPRRGRPPKKKPVEAAN